MALPGEHICFAALVFLSILTQFSCTAPDDDDSVNTAEIDVKPGGVEHTIVKSIDMFSCEFTYVCQGGTNEKWELVLTASGDKRHFSCAVERPSGVSYLFFQSFSLQINGADIVEIAAFSDLANPLKKNEYMIDYSNRKVSQLKDFQSKLCRLEIYATVKSKHSEL